MATWLKENNRESDVVVSTRVRLARNMADTPFPAKLRGNQGGWACQRGRPSGIPF